MNDSSPKIFFTVHDEERGIRNPESKRHIEALKQSGCFARVLLMSDLSAFSGIPESTLVVLLDSDRPNVYRAGRLNKSTAPEWVRAGWCVEIRKGRRAAARRMSCTVRQISEIFGKLFFREHISNMLSRSFPVEKKPWVARPVRRKREQREFVSL